MRNSGKTFGKLKIPLLLLLAISFSALPAQAKYGGGTGEPNDPYLIFDANHMNAIGADSNDWDKHFMLMADIDLSGFDGQDGRPVFNIIAPDEDSSTWQFDGVPFAGVFDGNNHTISNFSYTSTGINYLGLFGHVDGPTAEIKNLGLIDPNVDAGIEYYIGSLVGLIWKGTVTACYVEGGSVSGSNFVGGLVGRNGRWRGTVGTITKCYSTASVSGDWYVGGLVGYNVGTTTNCYSSGSASGDWLIGGLVGDNTGTITNCCSTSSVSGNSNVGGLAGENCGTTTNCCSTGSVSGDWFVGGLVGSNYHGLITNSYSTAGVSGVEIVGGLVGYNYGTISNCYSSGSALGNRKVGGLVGFNYEGAIANCYSTSSVSGDRRVGGLVGYSGDWSHCFDSFWDTDTSGQTTSGSGTGLPTAEMQTQSTFIDAGWDLVGETANGTEDIWKICEGEDYPKLSWEKYGGGTGESNNPYLIYTSCQMNAIGADPNDWDKHFKLMADIDLSGFTGTSFNIIGEHYYDAGWVLNPFTGVFDGNGHTISNFTYTSTEEDNIGLFGYVDSRGEIKDLGLIDPNVDAGTGMFVGSLVGRTEGTITDCYAQGGSVLGTVDVGGLVGYNEYATISYCYSNSSVLGTSSIGGLIGSNLGTITDCYSAGSISGNKSVGGLVGATGGTITNCNANGSVSGNRYIGGLVGANYHGTITNSYATSSVTGTSHVGGLLGYNYDYKISNCYSTGSVSGDRLVGGLVGDNWGIITNCYSTGSVMGENNVGGLVGNNRWLGTIINCYSTGSITGGWLVGGLVGYNNRGTIANCYSTSSALGTTYIGGLVGKNVGELWYGTIIGTITNCYSTGGVSGESLVGGLVGYNEEGEITDSFWDMETSGQTTSDGGTGKTTDEMYQQSTFTDWDFNTPVWTIDEDVDYPRLWWEMVPVLHAEPEITLGTSNTISWDPVPGAVEYYAECGEDANFTSILYNSGWITETSFEFIGLEAGRQYWYSVKARNEAGAETCWSNVESSLQGTLADLVSAIDVMLAPETLKGKNLKGPLLNKINVAVEMIDKGLYTEALNKLENDILSKTNGCGKTREPDKNDWIITCEGQNQVYPLVMETIEYVRGLME